MPNNTKQGTHSVPCFYIKTDKKRAHYYNYYTNKKWSDAGSYDLCLCSSTMGIEGTVQAIIDYVKLKETVKRQRL